MTTNRRRLITAIAAVLLVGWQVVLTPLLGAWNLVYCALLTAAACVIYARLRSPAICILVAIVASALNFLTPVPNYLCVDSGHAQLCTSIFSSVLEQSRFGLPEALLVMSYLFGHMLLVYAWRLRGHSIPD